MLTAQQIDTHVQAIARDGYTVIENAIEPALVDALVQDLERLERDVQPANNSFEGRKTLRVYNLLARGRNFERVAIHPHVLPVVDRVLDDGCLVSSMSSSSILPGEAAQPIHADDFLIPLPKPHVPIVCNTVWALTDFSAENGATRVVPGSHRADRSPALDETHATVAAVTMPRGSVLMLHGSLWHGGGANQTESKRVAILMNYCAGYIRQQENQQLGIPRETVRTFPPRLRTLVGYGIYHGVIGQIDRFNPVDLLGDGTPRRAR
jgi:ectoine hydroxylase-related dioxygenase (phytanoyl-CoA dioxygenase family)